MSRKVTITTEAKSAYAQAADIVAGAVEKACEGLSKAEVASLGLYASRVFAAEKDKEGRE